jgi:hypothetical protein
MDIEEQEQSSLLDGGAEEQQTQEEQAQTQQTQEPQQTQQTQEPAVPEEYSPFNAPEGSEPIDETTNQELAALGKEMKLTQEQMQKLVDYGAKKIGDGMEAVRLEALKKRQEWRTASEKDSEIADGIDHARRLVTSVGDDKFRTEFRDMMNETGIGDNPVFIRFCIQAGKLLGEDSFVRPERKPAGEPESILSMAHSIYPNMK